MADFMQEPNGGRLDEKIKGLDLRIKMLAEDLRLLSSDVKIGFRELQISFTNATDRLDAALAKHEERDSKEFEKIRAELAGGFKATNAVIDTLKGKSYLAAGGLIVVEFIIMAGIALFAILWKA